MKQSKTSRWLLRLSLLALLAVLLVLPAQAADWTGARNALAFGMKQEAASIDISAYDIPVDSFWDQYNQWVDQGYFPWYVDGGGGGTQSGGEVVTVNPNYLSTSTYSRSRYEQRVAQILEEAVYDGMSQWQIALSLHDYLIANAQYDQRYYTGGNMNYTGYDLLVNGTAVCEGYASAYMDLMNRAGVRCIIVRSSEVMDHCWNLVQIGGKWYHVDVTWDDPSFTGGADVYGYTGHDYFLLSDATISDSEHEHSDWNQVYTCTDTTYETDVFWEGLTSGICHMDTTVSFQRRGDYRSFTITRRDAYTGDETVLCTVNPDFFNIGSGNYYYTNFGLSLWNGSLYFSDTSHVYTLDPAGGEPQVVYTYDVAGNNRVIYGSFVRDNQIYISTRDASGNVASFTVKLPSASHTHSYSKYLTSPTCMAQGYTTFTCSCGSSFTSGYTKVADHKYGSYTVLCEPGFGVTGLKESVCVWCGQTNQETISSLETAASTFVDVEAGKFYYEPVLWAAVRGITTGTDTTHFGPNDTCTRAQVVTFLWRACGEPEPSSRYNPFTDVKASDYYYKAVLWAVEQGITNGVDETHFCPKDFCTRGHVVTFLHRLAGTPSVAATSSFTDLKPGAYYYDAVLWAVNEGITKGMDDTHFAPGATCTRGQIVTFLHRYIAE